VSGKIVSNFGKEYDPDLKLNVFKKGVEIAVRKSEPVKSIFAGRVAYSGRLSGYGNVTIVDHGRKYYSILGNLERLGKKAGDLVSEGEILGWSTAGEKPVYFEIRSKNVALNPLRWVSM